MKKKMAGITAAMILLSQTAVFAESPMEKAVQTVKERIEISQDLTEFESATEKTKDDTIYYLFGWSFPESADSVSVAADEWGRILEYNAYRESWYTAEEIPIYSDALYTQVRDYADRWLKKAAPELFADETDCLKPIEPTGEFHLKTRYYDFSYERVRDGLSVLDNEAHIRVCLAGDEAEIASAQIMWDYDAEFNESASVLEVSEAEKAYQTVFPLDLTYRRYQKDQVFLEYQTGYAEYIDAETGEKAEPKKSDEIIYFYEKSAATEDSVGSGGGLSEAERKEIDAVQGLKTAREIETAIRDIPELAFPEDMMLLHETTYKTENGYLLSLRYAQEERGDFISVTVDAESGKLLSWSRSGERRTEEKNREAAEKADAFLQKYYADILGECRKSEQNSEEESASVLYHRVIDGAIFHADGAIAEWNPEEEYLSSLYINWTRDLSVFPSTEKAIDRETAYRRIFEKYPLELIWISEEDGYKKAWRLAENSLRLDALNGKFTEFDGKEKDEFRAEYDDLSGHWAEAAVKQLAACGIALRSHSFMPNAAITQEEFLRLLSGTQYGYTEDTEQVYRRMIRNNVLREDEKNPQSTLTREEAAYYLIRMTGFGRVAELDGIYRCNFADEDQISEKYYGYCALANGMKILNGADRYLNPQKLTTRAEAIMMIYQAVQNQIL